MYGRGARWVVNFFRYCLCWFLLASPLAFAADRVVVVEPSQLQRTYTPGSGPYAFKDSRSWSEPVSVQNGRINLPVTTGRSFGWAKVRAALKNALKVNPASVALNGAIAAGLAGVGYLLDPANNSINKTSTTFNGLPISNSTMPTMYEPTHVCGEMPASATVGKYVKHVYQGKTYAVLTLPDGPHASFPPGSSGQYSNNCTASWNGYTPASDGHMPSQRSYLISPENIQTTQFPLLDAELNDFGDTVALSPQVAADLAPDLSKIPGSFDYPDLIEFDGPASLQGEPVTTTTTTPTGTTVSESTPTYNFDYSSNPNTITTTTTTTTNVYQDGNLTLTQNTTNAGVINPVSPAPPQLEIPTDCEFMPTVCAWLDWFKTPAPMPEPDMPQVVDDEFRQEYTVSFGGSCPAPRTVDTQFGTLSLSWQPLCDLASIIRYLVIASASLYAAFIGLGISRGSN